MNKLIGYFLKFIGIIILLGIAISYWYITLIIAIVGIAYHHIKNHKKTKVSEKVISKRAQKTDYERTASNNESVGSDSSEHVNDENMRGKILDCGLYYGDIILLDWLNGARKTDKIPSSYTPMYGVNPLKDTYELIKQGYIKINHGSAGLKSLKIPELKKILKDNGQKISGRKSELIERIIKNIDETNYLKSVPKIYVASDDGKTILSEYSIFTWAKRNSRMIQLIEYIPYQHAKKPFELIGIDICQRNISNIFSKRSNYSYRYLSNFEYEISEFLNNIKKTSALDHFVYGIFIDYFSFSAIVSSEPMFSFPKEWDSSEIQSRIIKELQKNPISEIDISKIVNSFIKLYGNKLPFYLTENQTKLVDTIKDAISLEPSKFHKKRLRFLKNAIPSEKVFDV